MRDFIGIKLGDFWLDLPEELNIVIEIWNALFETERIPGTLTFPFTLPFSSVNSRLLGFPGHLSVARYRQPDLPCQLFLMGQLWRVGKLNVIKRTPKGYEVNFQTDVGDISTQIKEKSLRDLDLGTDLLQLQVSSIYPAARYALFPVRNLKFFDGKRETYEGYQNFYQEGFSANWDRPITPFPYLVHVLERTMAAFGYTVHGDWFQEEETRRLVLYNTYAMDHLGLANGSLITFANHVPDMKVNEFLKAIRTLFCLGMVFNPLRKEMEIIKLSDVVANRTYVEWTGNTGRLYDWEPTAANGFTLAMDPDGNDELQSAAQFLKYTVGAGKDPVTSQAGTLAMATVFGRLLPEASQVGGNLESSGEPGKFSLRLLSYRGLQPQENTGTQYPLGTNGTQNALGATIGTDALVWEGSTGLYQRRHQAWLGFLAEAEQIQTEQTFRIADLMGLDHTRRVFIRHESGTFTALWEKVNITVSKKSGLKTAKVPLRRIY